ncbi:molybdopterin molybdotransferase MoeA [Cryobacterium arcticum]|uniref:Molybdopterin molybdenumtransferase n=1 Tax=Cryobacterium arcticum TaxID=670052 RepID=A0A317ZQP6_9MICO|nr:gephyrin-like molybdotransferase Glp [Cryobacterium arcticum]PXA68801.1 molybdopterin molybdenumtransferase MoeA [Cryobacterium arcticum]
MSARTIQQYRQDVATLLAPLFPARVTETLAVSSARLNADPDTYRGRTLATAVVSPVALPPFDNSQMDGYAVRSADLATASAGTPVPLTVADRIAAGDPGAPLAPGSAAPIMTGAPIPAGADAVVPIEQADPPRFLPVDHVVAAEPDGTVSFGTVSFGTVSFAAAVAPGTFVRPTGSDVRVGEVLLAAGAALGPAQLGVLAGAGVTEIEVYRRIRVLLIATGHEIREPGSDLAAGQIYDSNSVILSQALREAGCTVFARPCRSDDAADLLELLADAAVVDLVVTVGGVSAGAREVVRDALGPLGVVFLHVAMQPGGPQGLGEITLPGAGARATVPVLTFPGNPVSALISFEVFLRPVLRRLAGLPRPDRTIGRAPLAHDVHSPAGKHQLRRGILLADGTLDLVGGASSHLLHSYAAATVLVHLPVGVDSMTAGETAEYWSIDD